MNVAIIGCGRMGQKRAAALGKNDGVEVACDVYMPYRITAKAHTYDWRVAVAGPDVDAVIVCTTPDVAPEIAYVAMMEGKHVLLEKPGAHCAGRLDGMSDLSLIRPRVRVGFNLRYHRAMRKARALVDAGTIGELLYVRGRYGHGGRLGYEKEWRCDPKISGGGVLIDLGVHLIDLSRWFMGPLPHTTGRLATAFWDCGVEDNAYLTLCFAEGYPVGQLHCSATEWKNTFQLEIFGRGGKIEVNGLGGSYGVERCTLYQMPPQMGPPETTTWEYPMPDDSFEREWEAFKEDIALKRTPIPGIAEAQAALRIVEAIYEANR